MDIKIVAAGIDIKESGEAKLKVVIAGVESLEQCRLLLQKLTFTVNEFGGQKTLEEAAK